MDIDYIFDHLRIEGKRSRGDSDDTSDISEEEEEPFIEQMDYFYEGFIGAASEAMILKLSDNSRNGLYVAAKFFYAASGAFEDNKETILFMKETLKEFKPFVLFPESIITFPDDIVNNEGGVSIKRLLGTQGLADLENHHNIMEQPMYGGFFVMTMMSGDLADFTLSNSVSLWDHLKKDKEKQTELLTWVKNAKDAAIKDQFHHGDLSLSNIMFKWYPEKNLILYRVIDFSSAVFPIGGDDLPEHHAEDIVKEWNKIEKSVKESLNKINQVKK